MLGMDLEPTVFRVDDVDFYARLDVTQLVGEFVWRGIYAAGLGDFVGSADRLLDFGNFNNFRRLSFLLDHRRRYFFRDLSFRLSWGLAVGGVR